MTQNFLETKIGDLSLSLPFTHQLSLSFRLVKNYEILIGNIDVSSSKIIYIELTQSTKKESRATASCFLAKSIWFELRMQIRNLFNAS